MEKNIVYTLVHARIPVKTYTRRPNTPYKSVQTTKKNSDSYMRITLTVWFMR